MITSRHITSNPIEPSRGPETLRRYGKPIFVDRKNRPVTCVTGRPPIWNELTVWTEVQLAHHQITFSSVHMRPRKGASVSEKSLGFRGWPCEQTPVRLLSCGGSRRNGSRRVTGCWAGEGNRKQYLSDNHHPKSPRINTF
jgi:hypothetical protein